MKKTNILFWVFTILFGGFMLLSALPDIFPTPDVVEMISSHLGYPYYIIPFLGIAKTLGVIAILIPADSPRIKEWAYAGLFFDLLGATYSVISVDGLQPQTAGMIPFLGMGVLSYVYYHKRRKTVVAPAAG